MPNYLHVFLLGMSTPGLERMTYVGAVLWGPVTKSLLVTRVLQGYPLRGCLCLPAVLELQLLQTLVGRTGPQWQTPWWEGLVPSLAVHQPWFQLLSASWCAFLAPNMTSYKAWLRLLWVCWCIGLASGRRKHFGRVLVLAESARGWPTGATLEGS